MCQDGPRRSAPGILRAAHKGRGHPQSGPGAGSGPRGTQRAAVCAPLQGLGTSPADSCTVSAKHLPSVPSLQGLLSQHGGAHCTIFCLGRMIQQVFVKLNYQKRSQKQTSRGMTSVRFSVIAIAKPTTNCAQQQHQLESLSTFQGEGGLVRLDLNSHKSFKCLHAICAVMQARGTWSS